LSRDPSDEVREQARLAFLANRINPMQEKNLKTFPFIFFNGVDEATVDYDFNNNTVIEFEADKKNLDIKYKFNEPDISNFYVCYSLKVNMTAQNDSILKRCEAIEAAVRTLFWKDTRVKVIVNDTIIHDG
jgi:hypothetical protein